MLLTTMKLFIAVASMIAAFKFEREVKDGIPIPLNDSYEEGFVWYVHLMSAIWRSN